MKKIFTKIKVSVFALILIATLQTSCSGFLDVLPDNVFQYEDLFSSQKQAYNALATLYTMLPGDHRELFWPLGDEYAIVQESINATRNSIPGASIMKGNQSATVPLLDYWNGGALVSPYNVGTWIIIRECDKFILNIERVPDMPAEMKADWKAQAKFLKAYYMFMLVQMYGPIIIPEYFDENGDIIDNPFQHRSKVEDCFDYIIGLIDETIPYLKPKRESTYLGQPDQVTAKAIKARVLLVRASPFFNGNAEYYFNFRDHNGEHFFEQTPDPEKWKAAADAAQDALDACEQYGFHLYRYRGVPYDYDVNDNQMNPDRMQTLYDLLFRITERWNEEIIWGWLRGSVSWSIAAMISKPPDFGGPSAANLRTGWAQASYQVMERYYTINGLPLSEDRTVNMSALHEIVTTPDENSADYTQMRGFMQPGTTTINMYMNREPRFYSDLGITGGYYRAHQVRIPTMMFQDTYGGFNTEIHATWNPPSGIAIQKIVHPESYVLNSLNSKLYPNPIIRVADLFLMKAEALNEYYGPTHPGVLESINEVRNRAGIPNVEESYGNPEYVTDVAFNKHLTKEGMREIILHERANEFAFEFAHRFWDMQRWKLSVSEFSRPLYAWNYRGTAAESFFVLRNIQGRKWGITECLWPINILELEANMNLIQNPGW